MYYAQWAPPEGLPKAMLLGHCGCARYRQQQQKAQRSTATTRRRRSKHNTGDRSTGQHKTAGAAQHKREDQHSAGNNLHPHQGKTLWLYGALRVQGFSWCVNTAQLSHNPYEGVCRCWLKPLQCAKHLCQTAAAPFECLRAYAWQPEIQLSAGHPAVMQMQACMQMPLLLWPLC